MNLALLTRHQGTPIRQPQVLCSYARLSTEDLRCLPRCFRLKHTVNALLNSYTLDINLCQDEDEL